MSGSIGLVATRLALEPGSAPDPFALTGPTGILFLSEGRVLVGLGHAATISLPHGLDADLKEAGRRLASIRTEDRARSGNGHTRPPASGVIAFGALPFDRSAPASLVVPEIVVAKEPNGDGWAMVVAPEVGPGAAPDRSDLPSDPDAVRSWLRARSDARIDPTTSASGSSPAHLESVSTLDSSESFEAMVDEALTAIGRGALQKVVLARRLTVTATESIDISGLLRRWHDLEPDCTVFSMPGPDGQFVGASPELLVERSGLRVRCRPLAGTTFRRPPGAGAGGVDGTSMSDPSEPSGERILPAELLASRKDGTEHRLVVEAIAGELRRICSSLDVPSQPDLVHLRNMVHLGTSITGRLEDAEAHPAPSALELVGALHPTPAVGGVPTEEARGLIARLESGPRGRYAGPVGYLDATGDGKWMLGIRAASIRGRTAHLAAGVGIVRGSEPRMELAETILKFNAVLEALAPGFRLGMPGSAERQRQGLRALR